MIYGMCGLEQFPFVRLIEWIDKACQAGFIQEEVIIQAGATFNKYKPISKQISQFSSTSHEGTNQYIGEASKIIMHAGVGSFLQVYSFNKVPIIVPRQAKFQEHVDDHQIELVEDFRKEYQLPYALDYDEFIELLKMDIHDVKIESYRKDLVQFLDNVIGD